MLQKQHPENVPLNDMEAEDEFDDIDMDIEEEHESNGTKGC